MRKKMTKSKHALMLGILSLVKTTDFSNLTVKDICRESQVGRSTFYNHFNDKQELFDFTVQYYLQLLSEIIVISNEDALLDPEQLKREFYDDSKLIMEHQVPLSALLFAPLPHQDFTYGMEELLRLRIRHSVSQYEDQYKIPLDLVIEVYTNIAMETMKFFVKHANVVQYEVYEEFFEVLLSITKIPPTSTIEPQTT